MNTVTTLAGVGCSGGGAGRRMVAAGLAVALGCAGCSTGGDQAEPAGPAEQHPGQAPATSQAVGTGQDAPGPADSDSTAETSVVQVGSGAGLAEQSYVPLDRVSFAGGIDDADPASVLTGGLAASFAWRPAEDGTQFEAFRRAHSAWNNTYLADNETRLTTLVPMSWSAWIDWSGRGVRFTPQVTILGDQHPRDTDTDFSRVVKIDQVAVGGGRPDTRELSLVATVRVHKTDLGWRLDNLNVIDNLPGDS